MSNMKQAMESRGHTMDAVCTEDLCKRYKEVKAVDSLNLRIGRGEIYGFLGRNGAGKTTTIRMLLGLIKPTRGRALLFGRDVQKERSAAVSAAGSLVETATFYPSLTVRENLEIQRRLTGKAQSDLKRALDLVNLGEYAERHAGRLSLGNKQRLALARALLSRPRLLILDEPANGLDPAGIVDIRQLLRRLADQDGVTIFISSHILGEIKQLADRIGIIHRGRLIEEFTTGKAAAQTVPRLRIKVSKIDQAAVLLKETFTTCTISRDGEETLELAGPEPGAALDPSLAARVLVQGGFDLRALVPVEEDLEARFLRLTGGEE